MKVTNDGDIHKQVIADRIDTVILSSPPDEEIWHIPYSRSPYFTGRRELMHQLSESFAEGAPQAIFGMGGVGKTQLAIEYAHAHRKDYKYVVWVSADTPETLIGGYGEVARLLGLSHSDAADPQSLAQAVRQWFEAHTKWLLILDNADDISNIRSFIPSTINGHVLITTRIRNPGGFVSHEVEPLDKPGKILEDGACLLLRRAGVIASNGKFSSANAEDQKTSLRIARELGGLPLAIDQAGAYIAETQCSPSSYLSLYKKEVDRLLSRRGDTGIGVHEASVMQTFQVSFTKIAKEHPVAAEVLTLCAFLAPDDITEKMITQAITDKLINAGDMPAETALDEAMAILGRYSLVKRQRTAKTLSLHRLVQRVLQSGLDKQEQLTWRVRSIRTVLAGAPNIGFGYNEDRHKYDAWLTHARLGFNWINQRPDEILTVPDTHIVADITLFLYRVGVCLMVMNRNEDALAVLQMSNDITAVAFGGKDTQSISSRMSIGLVKAQMGELDEAEALLKEVIVQFTALGTHQLNIAICNNNLAKIMHYQGRYEEAVILNEEALQVVRKELGETHPETATCIGNLADVYAALERYDEAEELLHKALSISPYHSAYISCFMQIKLDRGETLQAREFIAKREASCAAQYGKEHPITAGVRLVKYNMQLYALVRRANSLVETDPEQALALCDEGLEIITQIPLHCSALSARRQQETAKAATATVFNIIGKVYYLMQQGNDAYDYFTKALAIEPRRFEIYANRALLLAQTQDQRHVQSALDDFAISLKLNPRAHMVRSQRCAFLCRLERIDEALIDYELLRTHPSSTYLSRELTALLEKKYQEAHS